MRVRVFAHGEGAMNSLGGLRPDTVQANLTGNLHDFWHVLDEQGFVRNWNGDVSCVVLVFMFVRSLRSLLFSFP